MLKQFLAPLILALGFHGFVIGLFLIEWPQDEVNRVSQAPLFISAALISPKASETKPSQPKIPPPPKSKPVVKPAAAASKTKPKVKVGREKKPAQPIELIAVEPLPQPAPIDPVKRELSDPIQNQAVDALMAAVTEEIGRQAVTNDEQILAYIGQIQRDIVSRWSRPPSARNGMQAVLRVRLVPTGEVIDVGVEQSSGNEAFDRSALLAVERSDRFQVPSDSSLFEKNFRSFTVLFRPEDLLL